MRLQLVGTVGVVAAVAAAGAFGGAGGKKHVLLRHAVEASFNG